MHFGFFYVKDIFKEAWDILIQSLFSRLNLISDVFVIFCSISLTASYIYPADWHDLFSDRDNEIQRQETENHERSTQWDQGESPYLIL